MPRSAIRWVTGVLDLGVGILQGAPPPPARAGARAGGERGPLCLFDTRHSSFGVLSQHPRRIVSELSFSHRREHAPVNQQHQCTMPAIWEAVSSQRILATGTNLVKPRCFLHQPVFSCVPAAASVSTRIYTRDQTDNRCRQRHRVRKAVFVQLVCVRPKAFRNVVRSGQ